MSDFINKGSVSHGGNSWVNQLAKFATSGDATSYMAISDIPGRYQDVPHITDILLSVSGSANTLTVVSNSDSDIKLKVFMAANSQFAWVPRGEIILTSGDYLKVHAALAGNVSATTLSYLV